MPRFPFPAALLVGAALLAAPLPASIPVTFTDITAAAGIHFTRNSGAAAGRKWYPEEFGGGVGVLDVDGDGWPDLLFVNGRSWTAGGPRSLHGLYRNNRDGTFRDIVRGSGLDRDDMYAIGVAVADYDNDGRDDVYITALDGDRLFHNDGNSRFTDVTERAGIHNANFGVSAAWFDYDRDGLLDLFVANYVSWSPETDVTCLDRATKIYCGPTPYKGTSSKLFHNLGGGRFEDVTAAAGLNDASSKSLGVAVLDFNGDGWPDLFVANDKVPSKLYRNTGHGAFVEEGMDRGIAVDENGSARAAMGVDAADYDRSGRPHVVVGNFRYEMLGLYHNDHGRFQDRASRTEVARASYNALTWGVFFFDFDLDGFADIFAVNGGIEERDEAMDPRARQRQPPILLRNHGDGTFDDAIGSVGPALGRPIVGRGAAYADLDRDGDLDLIVTTVDGPAYVFRNDGANRHHWLRVRTVGTRSNRDGIGAVVTVTTRSGSQTQTVHSGSSYASQSELTLTFGLGDETAITNLAVEWPSGAKQSFGAVPIDQQVTIREGGAPVSDAPARVPTSVGSRPR